MTKKPKVSLPSDTEDDEDDEDGNDDELNEEDPQANEPGLEVDVEK